VSNICVYASTDAKQPIAIITPHEGNLRHALQAGSQDVDADGPLFVLCQNDKVKDLVLKDCNTVGKKNGFKPMEMLQAVILTAEEWTPENGFVTAAQKLQRKKIADAFSAEIKVRCVLVLIRGWFSNSHHNRRPTRINDYLVVDYIRCSRFWRAIFVLITLAIVDLSWLSVPFPIIKKTGVLRGHVGRASSCRSLWSDTLPGYISSRYRACCIAAPSPIIYMQLNLHLI